MSKKKRELLKLNLGCGRDKRAGYINVDVDHRLKPDVVLDLLKPLPFQKETVQEILLQDVLEHFTKEQAEVLLVECARVLKYGGKLIIRVPNVFEINKKYTSQPDLLMLFIYGDTSAGGTWGAHKYGYTPTLLEEIIAPLDLTSINCRTNDTNYMFELQKKKLSSPHITVYGSGWRPDLSKLNLSKFNGKKIIVCTDFISYISRTLITNKIIIWCVSKKYPALISKTLLRFLSKNVRQFICKNLILEEYVKTELKFSHLKIALP